MSPDAHAILEHLREVETERSRQRADPALLQRVHAVKAYQHRRFERSYADQLANPATADAARFFLDDLYGARDFSERDAQFARIVPALDRLFPAEVVCTVRDLAGLLALHAFLERGYDTFAAMREPQRFLDTIAGHERALARQLFVQPGPPPAERP